MTLVAVAIRAAVIQREVVLEIRVPVIGAMTLAALPREVIGRPRVT